MPRVRPTTIHCKRCGHDRPLGQPCASRWCREAATRKPIPRRGCSSGTSGAVAELLVAAELMRRGYEVFRALSPSCSCDLVAIKGRARLRVEVKTGKLLRDGTPFGPRGVASRYDLLAWVCDGHVHIVRN